TAADLQPLLVGTRELTRLGTARPVFGLPEDQLAPPVGTPTPAGSPSPTPVPTPTPSPGTPPAGTIQPPVPPPRAPPVLPPGSGAGHPAGVAPPVVLPSPSPAPLPPPAVESGVPAGPPSATIPPSPAEAGPGPSGTAPPAAASPAPGPARPTSAVLSPTDARIPVSGSGTGGLVVMGVQDLRGVDLSITYDPAVLEAQDVSPGPLLTLDGAPVGVNRGLETGRIRARFTRTAGSAGSGVVATMTFKGVRSGTAT